MNRTGNFWRNFDFILLGTTLILILFGILMIRSATIGAVDTDIISRVPDQIRYAIIGLVLVFVLAAVDYRLLGSLHLWLYIIMVALLILVQFLGVVGDAGSQRWINLGIRIQPSEIGKIIIIITLGHHLTQNYQKLSSLRAVIMSLVHMSIPTALIFIQPNLGTTIVFMVIWFAMIWAAGLRLKHIALFVGIILIAAPVMWTQMKPYQKSRITTFLSPESDPEAFYNILQARISIGSGGFGGKGYANGTQSQLRFLRVRHTDFIFSVIAEEFGFVGGAVVMVLISVVILRILRGARRAVDPLGSLICYGVAAIIFFQTVVSIGMNLNMLPVTGLTLPFISSGGTSLLSILAGIGLAESVIIRGRKI
ncbi:MAG: rod shape-determining protein RodA [Chloroflexi bacterium]|nr:rod shape-determining protein RodA [Chloroflexota bacterium]MCC6891839.1 rod shape-determining protein RodA [Anaerolineae bacterium]